jgi:hypothetical protein
LTDRFDTAALRRTGEQEWVPWRASTVTFISIDVNGRITQAQGIEDKRRFLREAGDDDCLLLAWPGQYRQDIFVIDDRDAGLAGLEPPSRR